MCFSGQANSFCCSCVLTRVSFIKDSNVCKSLSIEEKSCAKATGEESEEKIQKQITAAVKRDKYFLRIIQFFLLIVFNFIKKRFPAFRRVFTLLYQQESATLICKEVEACLQESGWFCGCLSCPLFEDSTFRRAQGRTSRKPMLLFLLFGLLLFR